MGRLIRAEVLKFQYCSQGGLQLEIKIGHAAAPSMAMGSHACKILAWI